MQFENFSVFHLLILDILYYEYYDLEEITTPVNVEQYHQLLIASKYDTDETKFLVEGF